MKLFRILAPFASIAMIITALTGCNTTRDRSFVSYKVADRDTEIFRQVSTFPKISGEHLVSFVSIKPEQAAGHIFYLMDTAPSANSVYLYHQDAPFGLWVSNPHDEVAYHIDSIVVKQMAGPRLSAKFFLGPDFTFKPGYYKISWEKVNNGFSEMLFHYDPGQKGDEGPFFEYCLITDSKI